METFLESFVELFAQSTNGAIELNLNELADKREVLSVALFDGYLTADFGKTSNNYTLTEKGKALIRDYEMQQAANRIVDALPAPAPMAFPALFRNINNGTIVLAIGETMGTVVQEATTTGYDEFAMPLGTFHTYFVPFYLTDVWQPIHEVTITSHH